MFTMTRPRNSIPTDCGATVAGAVGPAPGCAAGAGIGRGDETAAEVGISSGMTHREDREARRAGRPVWRRSLAFMRFLRAARA
ncbi:MAG TPA: hypothetical protein DCQ64_18700 [Candidatus Rokubacteria bacterium]|nr:hypothetical protein [Candidatus Rokubacteria bacterium]